MKLKKSAHAVYRTYYHIVWVTRYRKKILVKGLRKYLKAKLLEVRKYYPDWEFIEIGINSDHIHLYMVIPPKYSVSSVVEILKKNTSKSMKEKFSFLKRAYWNGKGIWGKGFFVSTVGISEEVIKNYIHMQKNEGTGQAELEE